MFHVQKRLFGGLPDGTPSGCRREAKELGSAQKPSNGIQGFEIGPWLAWHGTWLSGAAAQQTG
jgi:hypothetical protein